MQLMKDSCSVSSEFNYISPLNSTTFNQYTSFNIVISLYPYAKLHLYIYLHIYMYIALAHIKP